MVIINTIVICGRLCRDPESRYAGSGENTTTITRFSVAVNRKFKREGESDADFFNCVCFGKNAQFCEKYLHLGSKVVIRGWMKQDNYTNKDGQKVYDWKLNVDEIDFAEGKSSGDTNNSGSKEPKSGKKSKAEPKADENGFMDIPDELLEDSPFN